jgi:beta-lactamase class A
VLYGIRLLILGTGIAAIVGTVLSSINANSTSRSSEVAVESDQPEASLPRSNARLSAAVTQPLPLADELAAIKTELVSFEAMTPGLEQTVFFYDLETGNYIDINGSEAVSAASTIKVPILVAFLQAVDSGAVQLNQAITLREDLIAPGSGEMDLDEVGTQYTALEVATEMIVASDNTATNLMIALLGGTEALNQQFQTWGLESTRLRNLLPDLDGTNTISTRDLVRIMALIDQGELLNLRSRDRFFGIMQRTINRDLIPDGVADDTALTYNKTGDIGTSLGDVALVDAMNGNRYVVSVLVERPFNDGRASELIRLVSRRLYEEMSQPINALGNGSLPENEPNDVPPAADELSPDESSSPEVFETPDAPSTPQPAPNRQLPSNPEVPPG